MGNVISARRQQQQQQSTSGGVVADTECASGTYRPLHHQHQHHGGVAFNEQISCAETPRTLSLRSSFSSLFKHHGSKRSSGGGGGGCGGCVEHRQESWPVTQFESLFLPVFPTQQQQQQRSKAKEFRLVAELADGAFGKVCKVAVDESHDVVYAIKIISKSKVIKENLVGCILQECEILKVVGHHPFIVQFVDNWQSRRKLFILTEYVPNGELYALLQRHVIFPLLVVQLYVAQLALVLDFLHNAGVVHRDLKPENVLLDAHYNLKVIDFGLAKWLTYGAFTGTICGTRTYMAPEIFAEKPYGHAADWWSLGVVACRMLTGQFVRVEPDPSPITQPKKVHLPDTVELDAPSKDLLARILELDVTKRLRSLRGLQHIRFYYKFDFDDARQKRISGLELWRRSDPRFPS